MIYLTRSIIGITTFAIKLGRFVFFFSWCDRRLMKLHEFKRQCEFGMVDGKLYPHLMRILCFTRLREAMQ